MRKRMGSIKNLVNNIKIDREKHTCDLHTQTYANKKHKDKYKRE